MASSSVPVSEQTVPRLIQAGDLPPWEVGQLTAPPKYTLRNAVRVTGAGAIILGAAIGSGEWLIGPSVTAQFTAALLWVATASILLQWVFNEEACRYTLYTGEPIISGFMRTKPGPAFWGWVYSVLGFLQLGWPGWAASAATAIVAAIIGGVPGPQHAGQVLFWGYVTFLASVALFLLGRKVEQALEYAEWAMVIWILGFLLVICIGFVTFKTWVTVIAGFLGGGAYYIRNPHSGELMGLMPSGADLLMVAGFAAYAGAGGLGNLTVTNWVRDKGMGMAAEVGYIPAVVGGHKVDLAASGKVFEPTPGNVARFREWWKYIRFDQGWVFTLGCFLGMGLPAMLTVEFIKPGMKIEGMAVAVRQAEGISAAFGGLGTTAGLILWWGTLLTGFWILYSTQLGVLDILPRTVTDILWTGNKRIREWCKGDVRRLYYSCLIVFVAWGCIAINLAQPLVLILLGAFVAGLMMTLYSVHVFYVNRKYLPRELQAPLWRQLLLLVMSAFFGILTLVVILQRVFGIKLGW
ncbi:MAG TPA: Nramp family divalent metal transporter [Burkholderiales bacterium]|nr:Nramp family divalent metal transporter [Burkholderiales bacterium]